jgi:hypothetical protein
VRGVAAESPIYLVYALQDASLPIGNCTILVDAGTIVASFMWMSDSFGHANVPQPIPDLQILAGGKLFIQAMGLDDEGQFLGVAVLTNGMALRFGS